MRWQAARCHGVRRFLHVSTDEVYGESVQGPTLSFPDSAGGHQLGTLCQQALCVLVDSKRCQPFASLSARVNEESVAPRGVVFHEESPFRPNNPYSGSKVAPWRPLCKTELCCRWTRQFGSSSLWPSEYEMRVE